MSFTSGYAPLLRVVSIHFFTAILVACGPPPSPSTIPTTIEATDTTLGTGDVFDVRVYGEDALGGTYMVEADGSVHLPFVGSLIVAGLDPGQAADHIAKTWVDGGFLTNPHVSVLVKEYRSKRVSVLGAVSRPGTFPLTAGMTVVQAISLAGGFSAIANRAATVVTRHQQGETVRYRVNADAVSQGREEDPGLRAGDIVYVPERVF